MTQVISIMTVSLGLWLLIDTEITVVGMRLLFDVVRFNAELAVGLSVGDGVVFEDWFGLGFEPELVVGDFVAMGDSVGVYDGRLLGYDVAMVGLYDGESLGYDVGELPGDIVSSKILLKSQISMLSTGVFPSLPFFPPKIHISPPI